MEKKSIARDIFLHLKSKGFKVYFPGIDLGECLNEFIVIKNDGSTAHTLASTDVDLYSVMCYVPKNRYSDLEIMVQKVKEAMKEMEPKVMPYGLQTPSYYDDTFKAHMISIEYRNYKKWL